jgi:hypothetical protein
VCRVTPDKLPPDFPSCAWTPVVLADVTGLVAVDQDLRWSGSCGRIWSSISASAASNCRLCPAAIIPNNVKTAQTLAKKVAFF